MYLLKKIIFQARHDVVALDFQVIVNVFLIAQPK
jgi:hypothetical protein